MHEALVGGEVSVKQLVVVDESFLRHNFHEIFRLSGKVFVPKVVYENIQSRVKNVDVENASKPETEAESKDFNRNYQSHQLWSELEKRIVQKEWEMIGSSDTGWMGKISHLARLFENETGKFLFTDQKRIVSAIMYLQEIHPEEEINFLTEDKFLKEFIQGKEFTQGIFHDFFPKKNIFFGRKKDFKKKEEK